MQPHAVAEHHRIARVGWLRAAVMGANDGIVSTASIVAGVAASRASHHEIVVAGVAGLVAGAMSMAAGEYVSVSSQADTEKADLAMEREEIEKHPEAETKELADSYVGRGLDPALAAQVAQQLMSRDALAAHARDELGLSELSSANPIQAALTSALTFAIGAALPLSVAWLVPVTSVIWSVTSSCLAFLFILGWLAASAGGASPFRGALRVTFWSALAMAFTSLVGSLFGTSVG